MEDKRNNYIIVFDTETISLDKPFMYNLGWVVMNKATGEIVSRKDFVIERVWHNIELMNTAYYKDKRPLYIKRMRSRQVKMLSLAQTMRELRKDLRAYGVEVAYAFNSCFDERVFDYNCDFYKINNPLEVIEIRDIRKVFMATDSEFEPYKLWINSLEEANRAKFLTAKGNYKTTAECVYAYYTKNLNYQEEHTALADSEIEAYILSVVCARVGGVIDYQDLLDKLSKNKGCLKQII